jgi:cytochrome c peroxidase
VLAKLARDPQLVAQFAQAYPDGLTARNLNDALVTYDRSLVTPSRFDRYLRGDRDAISTDEKRGYELFKSYGCVACHQGSNIGGNMFQRFGAMSDYFKVRAAAGWPISKADRGRYNVTGRQDDMFVFKVPSLRNVALTAPYFNDASAQTLADAVDVMFRFQLGRSAPKNDKALIIKFLQSLTGTLQ